MNEYVKLIKIQSRYFFCLRFAKFRKTLLSLNLTNIFQWKTQLKDKTVILEFGKSQPCWIKWQFAKSNYKCKNLSVKVFDWKDMFKAGIAGG